MANEPEQKEAEIRQVIESYKGSGYTDGQIVTILKNKGYDAEIVDKIFSQPRAEFKATAVVAKKGRELDLKEMLPGLLAIIIIGLALLVVWYVFFSGPLAGNLSQQLSDIIGYSSTT